MKLKMYISQKKMRAIKAADEIGVSPQTFQLWVSGKRVPRKEQMLSIYRWSKGQVQPNDFYDLSDAGPLEGLPLFNGSGGHAATMNTPCKGGP